MSCEGKELSIIFMTLFSSFNCPLPLLKQRLLLCHNRELNSLALFGVLMGGSKKAPYNNISTSGI